MSPRQCAGGGGYVDEVAGDEGSWPVNGAHPAVDGNEAEADPAAGPLELLWFNTERLRVHGAWVQLVMENAHPEVRQHDFGEMRCMVLESLLIMSHTAHSYLRHHDADVREAAETLTTVAAELIGRIFHNVPARLLNTYLPR